MDVAVIIISVAALLTHILNVVVVCVRPIETRPGSVFSTNAPVYGKLSEILCLSYVRPKALFGERKDLTKGLSQIGNLPTPATCSTRLEEC